MWWLVVFQHNFHGQYLPQVKEKLFLKDILCLERKCLRPRPLALNRTKQIQRCINNLVNRLLARQPSSHPKDGHFSEMGDFRQHI